MDISWELVAGRCRGENQVPTISSSREVAGGPGGDVVGAGLVPLSMRVPGLRAAQT
jgi:hypothetical protein